MEETMAARFWCHMCSQMVNPIMEVEIKCPFCQNGFVEEMSGEAEHEHEHEPAHHEAEHEPELGADRALSLWAPIFLGMMGNPGRRTRPIPEDEHGNDESELDREIESIIRRRRRSSATILQLLQSIQAGMAAEAENSQGEGQDEGARDADRERERERERVILINPFNQTIIVQRENHNPMGSLGDYFIGPGLDLLLQHLAENDPNRHGTLPAQKDVVEAMPSVEIDDCVQCSVCLDDMDAGTVAKEMPCKHKFHPDCILPWLDLHSSCPVCRFQMPVDESKREPEAVSRTSDNFNSQDVGDVINGTRLSFPWPFTGLFSTPPPPPPQANASAPTTPRNAHTDET